MIGIPEKVFLQASFIVYLLPLLALFAGALMAEWLFAAQELATLAGGLIGLAGGFAWVRRHAQRNQNNCSYQPTLLRRARPDLIMRVH